MHSSQAGEDLRLDERIQQLLNIVNIVLAEKPIHTSSTYRARAYAVTPLGARAGVICFVDNVYPLSGVYKHWLSHRQLQEEQVGV